MKGPLSIKMHLSVFIFLKQDGITCDFFKIKFEEVTGLNKIKTSPIFLLSGDVGLFSWDCFINM